MDRAREHEEMAELERRRAEERRAEEEKRRREEEIRERLKLKRFMEMQEEIEKQRMVEEGIMAAKRVNREEVKESGNGGAAEIDIGKDYNYH